MNRDINNKEDFLENDLNNQLLNTEDLDNNEDFEESTELGLNLGLDLENEIDEFEEDVNSDEDEEIFDEEDEELSDIELVDKKRKEFNDVKNSMIVARKMEIVKNIRVLHDKRNALLKNVHRTIAIEDEIDKLNVEIANECSKLTLFYQVQKDLVDKAKSYNDLLKKVKSDARKIFDLFGLPLEKLNEYFSDKANKRWYVNHAFWNNWIKREEPFYEKIQEPTVYAALKQLDMRCVEFEKMVGRSPSQFSTVYNQQIRIGMKKTDDARQEILERNIRLAMSIATKLRNDKSSSLNHLNYTDLYMEAIVGLILGVERFEYQRGFKLSTFVTWWIRQRITRSIDESRHIIKMPPKKDLISAIATINRNYENRYFKEPTQHYIILKHLLNLYIKNKKGIQNVLPQSFIDEHYENVEVDVVNYINGKWENIDGERVGIFSIIRKDWESTKKTKGGRKKKVIDNAINTKNNISTEEKILVYPPKDYLLWQYMLDLYENMYGIESFVETKFFQNHLREPVKDKNGKEKKRSKIVSNMKDIFAVSQPTVSLENEVGDEENNTYRDTIKADQISVEDEVIQKESQLHLIDILSKYLKPKGKEVQVLAFHHGLNMQAEQDFGIIAKHFGVSKERIRQIYNGAIKKLAQVDEIKELNERRKNGE